MKLLFLSIFLLLPLIFPASSFAKFSIECTYSEPLNSKGEIPATTIEAFQFSHSICISEDLRVTASISAELKQNNQSSAFMSRGQFINILNDYFIFKQ